MPKQSVIQVKRAPHVMLQHLLIDQFPENPDESEDICIASVEATSKGNTAKYKVEPFGHKLAGVTFRLTVHGNKGHRVITRLARLIADSLAREVRTQVQSLCVIITCQV